MTQQEIEAALGELRQTVAHMQYRDDDRRKRWRSVRKATMGLSLIFALGGAGFLVFSLFDHAPPSRDIMLAMGLLLASILFTFIRVVVDE